MAIIPSTFKLDWYDPSQPGGVTSALNDNANTATSNATQYTMEDIINTVSYTGGSIDGSGAEWALPVFTDTNTITNLPLGAAGELLTSGGAGVDPAWAAAPASGPYEVGAGADSAQIIGDGSNLADANASTVSGGSKNIVCATGEFGFIGGGKDNTILAGSSNVIGGGIINVVSGDSKDSYNGIFSGAENLIDCNWIASVIGGGGKNRMCDELNTGKNNGSIAGGLENSLWIDALAVGTGGLFGAHIGGGLGNKIQDVAPGGNNNGSVIAGGAENKIERVDSMGSIVGGTKNYITGPTADFTFIGGGKDNQITSANNASILGGESNLTQCNNAHIIGSGITATRIDATFVQGLTFAPDLSGIPIAADNAAALLLVPSGSLYRSGADPDVVSIVH